MISMSPKKKKEIRNTWEASWALSWEGGKDHYQNTGKIAIKRLE